MRPCCIKVPPFNQSPVFTLPIPGSPQRNARAKVCLESWDDWVSPASEMASCWVLVFRGVKTAAFRANWVRESAAESGPAMKTTISQAFCWRGYDSRMYIHSNGFLLQITDFPNSVAPHHPFPPNPSHPTKTADHLIGLCWSNPCSKMAWASKGGRKSSQIRPGWNPGLFETHLAIPFSKGYFKKGRFNVGFEIFHLKPCDRFRDTKC